MNTVSPNLINQLNDALAAIQAAQVSIQRTRDEIETLNAPIEPSSPAPIPKGPGYWLDGKWTFKLRAVYVMVDIFRDFARIDEAFPEKFAHAPANYGRIRLHIARTREALYPGRHHLMRHSREFAPGWFIGTNERNSTKDTLITAAANLMGYTSKDKFWFRLSRE